MFDRSTLLTLSLFSISILTTACHGGGGGDDAGTDAGPSFEGGTASRRIGPEGGALELGEMALEIPAGALSAEVEISVEASTMAIDGVDALSAVYVFSPSGLAFGVPVRLSFDLDRGAPGAKLFHGEDLAMAPEPIEATISDAKVEATITGFSYYVVGRQSSEHPIIDVDDGFEYEGQRYTAGPVAQGVITGFSYSYAGQAGISDGEAQGHVWYGRDYCVTFRADGTGVVDWAGGTDQRLTDFPWIEVLSHPNGAERVLEPSSQGMPPAGRQVMDPEYDRRSELSTFVWGVQVAADGAVAPSTEGTYTTRLVFDDETSSMTMAWDPSTNAPFDSVLISSPLSAQEPSDSHFCYFREKSSTSLADQHMRCLQSVQEWSGGLSFTISHCYARGMLTGPYAMTDMNGTQIEAGEFDKNNPIGGWMFRTLEGVLQATGNFNEYGIHEGAWQTYDYQGMPAATATFKGGLTPTGFGPYYRILSGPFVGYRTTLDGTAYKYSEGSLLDGMRTGPWYSYDELGTLTGEENYKVDTQIPNGEWCFRLPEGGYECVPLSYSWKDNANYYDWGGCVNGINTWMHNTYDMTGSLISQECYELSGTRDEPVQGASKSCGSACSQ